MYALIIIDPFLSHSYIYIYDEKTHVMYLTLHI